MKCLYKDLADNLNRDELESYYKTHSVKETSAYFNFDSKYLYRILHYLNIEVGSKERYQYINKNYVCTEERNRKVSESNKGRKVSDATIKKISESNKGHKNHHKTSTTWGKGTIPWNKGLKGVQKWLPDQKERYYKTLSENGWFNESKVENKLYNDLCNEFGSENVIRQYVDERYPYRCDFYVKPEDLFIEVNAFWHHGPHPFDSNNEDDIALLNEWKSKSTENNQYSEAIKTWTIRDVEKIQIANKNNLNYKLIY